jgi:DNA-binding MarR family transcriptional regulator
MVASKDLHQALLAWVRVSMRRSMHEFMHWMNHANLSNSQLGALMRLYYHGECPVSDIGDDLGITAAAASQMVDRLVQQGLLDRESDSHDRRVKRVTLTAEGRALVRSGVEARVRWLRDLEATIPPEQRERIVLSLQTLTDAAAELETSYAEAQFASLKG